MREWNRIKVGDGPGADWQGEREGRGGVGEGGADGAGEQNGSDPDNMPTMTVQVQPSRECRGERAAAEGGCWQRGG